mmetsp:Transcript_29336/g.49513  ORF Transcript_29336/g.49513 Transcript_29336/m.49513 type:complete len:473 (-) Transcript_29336:540-1958(-)|eukprot:CAMPEP_0114428410 /NCGR_PEP_ID=MMETSP0103-20121206/8910_1 /TAXON_ID=37642 ORGANISM="Paraphysomonas imperforata, Strain PA2" /NCGR_SAMPLE_ID=MMETSP0103 /ASSEMBLY_ACC=CAM_ASM_000201 /LENGTH=472 /DNA_ID=CAMNT_0001597623 /DNA_START=96 /DNA_END=1514 /DNA_ORIENTATION=-
MSKTVENDNVSSPEVSSKSSSICPPSLLKHLQKKADNLPWRIETSKVDNTARLLDDIFKFTEEKNIDNEKAIRRHIFESSEKVIKTLQLNENLMDAYEDHRVEVKTLVEIHDDLRLQNKRIFDEITRHHESLVADGYDTGVAIDSSLKKYKNAAHEMGKKEWVVLSNAWMESTAYNFFYETGAQRAYLKLLQHRSLFERGVPLSADDHNRFREATNDVLFNAGDVKQQKAGILKPRLLDVGSCYNPFKTSKHANMFDVTGIDLCPAVDSVYTCDFLTIQVGEPTSQPVYDTVNPNILLAYPSNSFEVVTMSLVLNYLPSPSHRELMVANARKLLIAPCESHSPSDTELPTSPHRSGLLLIVEKISIFDWKSNQRVETKAQSNGSSPSEAAPSRHEWIRCICDIGFELVTYQTNVYAGHHVHLFAFRVVPLSPSVKSAETDTGSSHEGRDRPRMRIKADVKVMSDTLMTKLEP